MKRTILFLTALAGAAAAAQAAYRIEAAVAGAENVAVYLARYEGMRPVDIDSAKFNDKGVVVFAAPKATLPGGLYMLRFTADENPQQLELVVSGEPKFEVSIAANMLNIEKSLKYSKSAENEGFKKFLDGNQRIGRKVQQLQQRYQQHQDNPDSIRSIQEQYAALMREQKAHSEAIVAEYRGTFLATLVRAVMEPDMPQFDVPENAANPDSIRQRQMLAFAQKHFFDNFDLADARIVNAPMLDNRMIIFFQQIMRQEPADTINAAIDALLARAQKAQPVYRFMLTWLYDRYTESPIEGHYAVGLHLCGILSDSTTATWLTDREKTKLKQNIRKFRLNPVGAAATDLTLQTAEGEFKSLHSISAPITLLYFFNPGCGSCLATTPVLHEIYEKYREQGVEVFAVYPDKDSAAWVKYVNEKGYTDWVNVWDGEGTAGIYEKYSMHAIPQVYVLDERKVVRYKDIYVNDLEEILQVELKRLNNK